MTKGNTKLIPSAAAVLALAALALLSPEWVAAQCALCKTALTNGGDAGASLARTMNLAILVLLVPPVAIFCSVFAIAIRHGRGDEEAGDQSAPRGNPED